jgi:hypothetical protein
MDDQRPTHRLTINAAAWFLVAVSAISFAAEAPGSSPHTEEYGPDVVADHPGGTAARLFDDGGSPIPGHVFLLLGPAGPAASARLYDTTPYIPAGGRHPDTVESNLVANRAVRAITGSDIEVVDMTSGSGSGPSGGLTRAIAYLNVVSDGQFTGDLRIAATGQLSPDGHIGGIDNIDPKTVAAHLADADVLFTPTIPTERVRVAHGARLVGEVARHPEAGRSLNDPRRLASFRQWGASRPVGMDIVDARHLIDVSSYLCGTGSAFACTVTTALDDQVRVRHAERTAAASSETERLRAVAERSASATG